MVPSFQAIPPSNHRHRPCPSSPKFIMRINTTATATGRNRPRTISPAALHRPASGTANSRTTDTTDTTYIWQRWFNLRGWPVRGPGAGFAPGAVDFSSIIDSGSVTDSCANDALSNRLGQCQPPELDPVRADLRQIILRLLGKPAFGAASKHLGQSHGHFWRNPALLVHQLRQRGARDSQRCGGVRDG